MKNAFCLLLLTLFSSAAFSKINLPETPFTEYSFDASQCKLIQHEESRIFVPAFTFYLDGKVFSGQVNLQYRQFTDQLDILINHIPMNYAENGRQHVLESGGMFELYAYGNGKLLSFGPEKKVTVQLATRFNMTGGETFVFDKSKNTWYKDTPFGNLSAANQPVSDNQQDLWGDNRWQNREPVFNETVSDINGNYWQVQNRTFKTIQVDKMQLYNCDKILNEATVPMIVEFKLEGYDQKLSSEVYVVYKNRNAVLTYYPEQFATDFKLLPGEEFTIFSIAKDGKVAVLDTKFLANFDVRSFANKKVVFPMIVYTKLPANKEELSAITGI